MKAALGGEAGAVVEVTQSGAAPCAFAAVHPWGNIGALAPSKFSENVVNRQGVGVGVGTAGGVGVGSDWAGNVAAMKMAIENKMTRVTR